MTYDTQASSRTVTAFFDSRNDAEGAVNDLVAAGFSRDQIRVVEGSEGSSAGAQTRARSSDYDENKGFWDSLSDFFMPDEDRSTYAEGLRRGGFLVTVTTTGADGNYERAIEILDREGSVDLEKRATDWRSEGWTEDTGRYREAHPAETTPRFGKTGETPAGGTRGAFGDRGAASTGRSKSRDGDEVIEVAEEQLRVGKREVGGGRVRVRSYVVETPVSEDVHLRDERVSVERRPVDRQTKAGEELFKDRTIDMEERREEAVVSKDARVTEEVVVGKDVRDRTETVTDTVRKTEVKVEDDRAGGRGPSERGSEGSRGVGDVGRRR